MLRHEPSPRVAFPQLRICRRPPMSDPEAFPTRGHGRRENVLEQISPDYSAQDGAPDFEMRLSTFRVDYASWPPNSTEAGPRTIGPSRLIRFGQSDTMSDQGGDLLAEAGGSTNVARCDVRASCKYFRNFRQEARPDGMSPASRARVATLTRAAGVCVQCALQCSRR